MNSYGWYGVVFALEDIAREKLKQVEQNLRDGIDSELLLITETSIYLNLSKALRAGLERSHQFEMQQKE